MIRLGKRAPGGILAACTLLALPGCATLQGSAACDTPPPFFARLDVAESVNFDSLGRSLPTVVQVVQLKDSARLERATYQRLWAEPKEVLGEDLLQAEEFIVAPGRPSGHWLRRDPKARFVAAMGLFRQHPGFAWLAVAQLPPVPADQCVEQPIGERTADPKPDETQLRFKLQGYQIDYLRPSRRPQ